MHAEPIAYRRNWLAARCAVGSMKNSNPQLFVAPESLRVHESGNYFPIRPA
jgi:hypothetical protein